MRRGAARPRLSGEALDGGDTMRQSRPRSRCGHRLAIVLALAAVSALASIDMGDASGPLAQGVLASVVSDSSMWIEVSGESLAVALIDPYGRRASWENGEVANEIPACAVDAARDVQMYGEEQLWIGPFYVAFRLDRPSCGAHWVTVRAKSSTKAMLFVARSDSCYAGDELNLPAGADSSWAVSWVSPARHDTCAIAIERGQRSTKAR